ncbi:serine/threonine-protein kinase [Umezawaea sp. Da 62-37]|uniref:serine/threonine-protein kinase n=1 Tax=Umezawaea sp. Da 62-37 TaxID=3075927 RepID=UPI0028F6D629|nr:serine/threonine-protein kinase [Umezawaea sp. Da 62-37]WNV85576.1 serine/threonine-protein kinase [Umezawaea sp. Da 62-37]
MLKPGDRVNSALTVDRGLGEGAYAEVYRVKHEFLGLQAMKLFKRVASLQETREMLGEARLLSKLGHPNIVRLFDANTLLTGEGRRGYFTMEYVAGGSLDRLVRTHPTSPVPISVAVDAIEQITAALVLAHGRVPSILHRDLTPANVLVGYEDTGMRVRLSDFGLSKRADPVTQLASAQGTFAFMAPEVRRLEGYSCAGDVWSLGTIAYLLLTNHYPFHDGGPFDPFPPTGLRDPVMPPSSYNDEVDPELDRIVLATLERDPRKRTPNARVLARELDERREVLAVREEGPVVRARPADRVIPEAEALARRALALAKHPETLREAADVMEEAMTRSALLREKHLHRLALWRRGVMM